MNASFNQLPPKDRARCLDSLVENPAWPHFTEEMERRVKTLREKACNLDISQAHRDGAAGAANEIEGLAKYVTLLLQSANRAKNQPSNQEAAE